MQIRELDLKELDIAYELVSQFYEEISYKEFEDTIYDMRDMNYLMIGIIERGVLVSYAGIAISTNLQYKRHLQIYELVTDQKYRGQKYAKTLLSYIDDYAKIGMCSNITAFALNEEHKKFLINNGFEQKYLTLIKRLT